MPFWIDPVAAVKALMSGNVPPSESTVGAVGGSGQIPDASHSHPRISNAIPGNVIGSAGTVDVPFAKQFPLASPPITIPAYAEASDNQPVIIKRVAWILDVLVTGTTIVGATFKAYRTQKLPAVLTLLSALIGYDIAAGSAVGISFDLLVLKSG